MKETKTVQVKRLIQGGNWKAALSILRMFRLEFTKPQKRLIEISSDVYNGNGNFYKQIGVNTEQVVADTKVMLLEKYCPSVAL